MGYGQVIDVIYGPGHTAASILTSGLTDDPIAVALSINNAPSGFSALVDGVLLGLDHIRVRFADWLFRRFLYPSS
jgi:hypothetical protein